MRLRGVGSVAGLCAALIAGCGNSTLSTGELRSDAGAICRSASTRLAGVGTPGTPAAAQRFLHQGLLALTPPLAQLRALHASGRAGQELNGALGAFERKLVQLRGAEGEITRGADPVLAIRTLQQRITPIVAEENGHWRALGISACLNR